MWVVQEYWCDPCRWRGESLEERPAREHIACGRCGEPAEKVISAPKAMTVWGTVQRGASDEKPPHACDTEPLASGVSYNDWAAGRKKARAEERRVRNRKLIS